MEERIMRARHERTRTRTVVGERSRTKQSFKKDCDINTIVKRHQKTGTWDHLAKFAPNYGDFSQAQDLHAAMDQVMAAQEEFGRLPADVRNLCDNNPEILLRALGSPEETAALYDAGLPMADNFEPWREEEEPERKPEAEEAQEKPPEISGGK